MSEESLIYRLRKRAEIRRSIPNRKSVQEGAPDKIADLLDEAAQALEFVREWSEVECAYGDGCPPFGTNHGICQPCKARNALGISGTK